MVLDFEQEWVLNAYNHDLKKDFDLVGKEFINFDYGTKPFAVHLNGQAKLKLLWPMIGAFRDLTFEGGIIYDDDTALSYDEICGHHKD